MTRFFLLTSSSLDFFCILSDFVNVQSEHETIRQECHFHGFFIFQNKSSHIEEEE